MHRLGAFVGAALGAYAVVSRRRRGAAERFAAAAMESLLRAIDANDADTGAHVRRVATYSLVLADAMDVSAYVRRTIELAALFHDIGKIHEALFDIIHDDKQLSPAERRAVRTHPARGAEVLAPIATFYPDLADAVLAHHERWNGSGYPRGLRGRRIPFAARVVMLADTYDAITHRRRYRGGRSSREARRIILEGRGVLFDPEVVDLMMLPPVFHRIARAERAWTRRGNRLPQRVQGRRAEAPPEVEIRWRTRSEAPPRLREKLAGA